MNDAIEFDIVVIRKPTPELPPPFVCVICRRTITADLWRPERHKPPVCFSCAVHEGVQVRMPGITRGDHTTLQRLTAITNALMRAATWEVRHGRFRSI